MDSLIGAAISMTGVIGSGLLAFYVTTRTSLAVTNEKILQLRRSDDEANVELKETAKILREVGLQVAASIEKQGVVNQMTMDALRGILTTQERHSKEIADHGAALSLLSGMITGPEGAIVRKDVRFK